MDSKQRKKVLICIDKFKGTLTQQAAGRVLSSALQSFAEVEQIQISDGGEGFLKAIKKFIPAVKSIPLEVHHPQGKRLQSTSLLIYDRIAYLEVATLAGLQQVEKQGDIFEVSSYGVGEAIKICLEQHAVEEFVIGCGGSAFSDAGYGCMSAIFDLPRLESYQDILSVQELNISKTNIQKIVIPCDVQSPLCGPTGAAYMFGPQKGAQPDQLPLLDECVSHTIKLYTHFDEAKYQQVALAPGSGASGGIVGAFKAVFGDITQVVSGLDFIADLAHLEDKIKEVDLVITGEGSYDQQSLQGKAAQRIIEMCQRNKTKYLVICGRNLNPQQENIIDLTQRYGAEQSLQHTEACLKDLSETYITSLLTQN